MDLRQLKDQAQVFYEQRDYVKASELYGRACAAAPQDLLLRQRWATVLHRAGQGRQAFGILKEIAAAYAADGDLLRAIAVNKLLLEIEPSHTETQKQIAQLYARRSPPRRSGFSAPPPLPVPEPAPRKGSKGSADRTVVGRTGSKPKISQATTEAERPLPRKSPNSRRPHPRAIARSDEFAEDAPTDREVVLPEEENATEEIVLGGLPKPSWGPDHADRVKMDSPLFENLDSETFIELLQQCKRRTFAPGEALIRQGDSARSFFVLIEGTLRVVQGPLDDIAAQIELARLASGDFFGEMALVSRSPRTASVVAVSEGDALEFPGAMLDKIVARSGEAKTALQDFMRARLLQNAMASSEVFRPFSREQRRHFFPRFSVVEVPGGTALLTQGKPADGFYVIMEGSFRVDRDGETLNSFAVGDCFGEISLLTGARATASVIAEVTGRVLRLPAPAFQTLVATHPQVQAYAKELELPRKAPARHVSSDKIESDVKGLVLV